MTQTARRFRRILFGFIYLLPLQGVMPGCWAEIPPCFAGIDPGKDYRITIVQKTIVVEKKTTNSNDPSGAPFSDTCGDGFDLVPGSTLTLHVDKLIDADSCRPPRATLVSVENVTLLALDKDPSGGGGNVYVPGPYKVRIGEQCTGWWYLSVSVAVGNEPGVRAAKASGSLPPISLIRSFQGDIPQPGCTRPNTVLTGTTTSCSGFFDATIAPL